MINEERIKLMTKAAVYEKRDGRRSIPISHYYKSDYISLHMISACISATVAYLLIAAAWIGYHFDFLMNNVHKMDLMGLGMLALRVWLLLLIVYVGAAFFVYHKRYEKAKKSLRRYFGLLRRIEKIYEKEERVNDGRGITGGKS